MFESLPVEHLVEDMATTDPVFETDKRVVELVRCATAVAAWAEGYALGAVAELRARRRADHDRLVSELGGQAAVERAGGPAGPEEVDRLAAVEAAAALRVSQSSATRHVRLGDSLRRRQPYTLRALSAGLIGLAHARAIEDALSCVADDEVARQVASRVLHQHDRRAERAIAAGSPDWHTIGTPGQLGAAVRRAVATLDDDVLEPRCEVARRGREVTSWPLPDGMAALCVTGSAPTILAAFESIDARARLQIAGARSGGREPADGPTVGAGAAGAGSPLHVPTLSQARADAALRLLVGSPDITVEPVPHVRVNLDVLVPLEVLRAGPDIAPGDPAASGAPAELPAYGPLPAHVARTLAAASTCVRVVPLDAHGRVWTSPTDGRAAPAARPPDETGTPAPYRPGAALAARVRARDTTCRWPGCRRRANACDLDHTVPYPAGPTTAANLASLCRLHHRAKHRGGWTVSQEDLGRLRFISPTGELHITDPPAWHSGRSPCYAPP